MRCFLSVFLSIYGTALKLHSLSISVERSKLWKLVHVQCIVPLHESVLAMAVHAYVPILLALLMCVGCHGHDTYSNIMENSTTNVGENGLVGTHGIGPLQQCLNEESLVTRMDPTIPRKSDNGNVSCPAWSVKHEGSSKCECGSNLHGKITCCQNMEKLLIFQCFCVTYDSITDRVIAGGCMYTCFKGSFYVVTSNRTDLTMAVCDDLNREGPLCSQCKDGYAAPIYLHSLQCIKCTKNNRNLIWYFALTFVPLTAFLFLVIAFRINASSPALNTFVLLCQAIACPQQIRATRLAVTHNLLNSFARVLFALYGIWNLDFFRTLVPPFCLTLSSLETLALDYAVAAYPLVVLVVAYVLVELHARGCRIVALLWRPFHKCFAHLSRQWDVRSSIIDAFATFLLLSSMRFLSVSFDLLKPTRVYDASGSINSYVLSYDQSVELFHSEHIPFGILAVCMFLCFNVFPIFILLMFPSKCFQKLCQSAYGRGFQALRTFTDAFQGCFKDGTNGTRDCRYFAAVYPMTRIVLFATYALAYEGADFFSLATLPLIVLACLVATVRPYSQKYALYNYVDMVMICALAVVCDAGALGMLENGPMGNSALKFTSLLICVTAVLVPLIYITLVVLKRILWRRNSCFYKLVTLCLRKRGNENVEDPLPDRLLHPNTYYGSCSLPVDNHTQESGTY